MHGSVLWPIGDVNFKRLVGMISAAFRHGADHLTSAWITDLHSCISPDCLTTDAHAFVADFTQSCHDFGSLRLNPAGKRYNGASAISILYGLNPIYHNVTGNIAALKIMGSRCIMPETLFFYGNCLSVRLV